MRSRGGRRSRANHAPNGNGAPSDTPERALERLAFTLLRHLPDLLYPEPNGLSPRTVVGALTEARARLDDLRGRLAHHERGFDAADRELLLDTTHAILASCAELLRHRRATDIIVYDPGDDWPIIRKLRQPLTDWDIWTLYTIRDTLRRSNAIVSHAERHAAQQQPEKGGEAE